LEISWGTHHLDRKNFLFGQNGAPKMMLEDIMHAKKYVEDIKNGKGAK
jgi:hypothetical protein